MFYAAWWAHLLILLTFLVYVPQSKHAHLIAGPANVFFSRLTNPGKLQKIDFEDETKETFGVGRIEEFRQSQLIDLYACVECGRCTNMCPATGTGKMLSPMDLILRLRDHLTEKEQRGHRERLGYPHRSFSIRKATSWPWRQGRRVKGSGRFRTLQPELNRRHHHRRRNLGLHNMPEL